MKKILLLLAVMLPLWCLAQTGTVINEYAAVYSYTTCPSQLTVDTSTGFAAGDMVLIIQMKGVDIDSSNTVTFGNMLGWNSVGNYEINKISSVSGTSIQLAYLLERTYDFSRGKVQLVKIPRYTKYTVNTLHTCRTWDNTKGGIFAIIVDDSLIMNNNIDVTGNGFVAGITDTPSGNTIYILHQPDYCYPHQQYQGGMKGEGVAEVSHLKMNCRGPLYNGGGGGNSTNCGGGGGGNAGSGGKGGDEWFGAPGGPDPLGGLGGNIFTYSSAANKLYMAGAGGAGHINDNNLANGGNGGGMVMIIANKIIGKTNSIIADGQAGLNCISGGCIDGVGGGGAGGTVLINAGYVNNLNLSVKGGTGASVTNTLGPHGTGGGGGGGVLLINDPTLLPAITVAKSGGAAGMFNGPGGPTVWGAEAGNDGTIMPGFFAIIDTVSSISSTGFDTTFCTGDSVMLTTGAGSGTTLTWSTGSTASSIEVSDTGTYWVHIAGGGGCVLVDTFYVHEHANPIVDLGQDISVCAGVPVTISSALSYSSPAYSWNTGATTPSITVDTSGSYSLTVSQDGCMGSDTVNVVFKALPVAMLGNDTMVCTGNSLNFSVASYPGAVYTWNTGSTDSFITITKSGTYSVTVTENGCTASDSVTVIQVSAPYINLGPDTTTCNGQEILLPVNESDGAFLWSTGSTAQTCPVTETGTYWVTLTNVCGSKSDTIKVNFENCNIWFPSAFTPNGDGLNDIIRVRGILNEYTNFSLSIYDRFGNRVFYTQDIYQGWNGTYNGVKQDLGTYFYMIFYTLEGKKSMMKGDFQLIR